MATVSLQQMDYEQDSNRVVPVIEVNSGSKVLVDVTGVKLSKSKLKQLIPVYEEQSVDKDLLVEGKRNLKEYLESKGYFDSDVDFDSPQMKSTSS